MSRCEAAAKRLFEMANRAAGDAARLARQEGGAGLAQLRRRDARRLRKWARALLA